MKLLTKAIARSMPPLYATENVPLADKVVRVKYFDPCGSWAWYGVEGEPCTADGITRAQFRDVHGREPTADELPDWLFFGLVDGLVAEWGYFRLSELRAYRGRLGIGIERDLYFGTPKAGTLTVTGQGVSRV